MITQNVPNSSASPGDENSLEATEQKQNTIELSEQELLISNKDTQPTEITREQLSLGKRLLNWRTLIPLVVVVAGIIIFALPAINLQQTWNIIRGANMYFFLAAFAIYYLSFPLRTFRWRILLENVGFTQANGVRLPNFWKILEIIYISFFVNVVVPAKLGDVYRAYMLGQETKVSATRSFGTVLAERFLDIIVILLLCVSAVLISLQDKLPSSVELVLIVTLGVVFVGILSLVLLRRWSKSIEKLVPGRFRDHYVHFQEGMLGSFRRLPTLSALTFGTWICESLRFCFVALALGLIQGDLIHIISAAFFIGLVEALLTAVPFTGGGLGLVETGMAAMIVLFNPAALTSSRSLAAAAILLDRSISLFSILVIGFIVFLVAFSKKATRKTIPLVKGVSESRV